MATEQRPATPPVHAPAPPVAAPAPVSAAPPEAATDTGMGAAMYGQLADGGFLAKLGSGLRLSAAQLQQRSLEGEALPQPLPGVRFQKLTRHGRNLDLEGALAIPYLEGSTVRIRISPEGTARVRGRLRTQLQLPALGSPRLEVGLDESGQLHAAVEFSDVDLLPRGLRAEATGAGRLALAAGRLAGRIQLAVAYPGLGSASADVGFSPEGSFDGSGTVALTPPLLTPLTAALAADAEGNLNGELQLDVGAAATAVPGLLLRGGTLLLGYRNQQPSLSITDLAADYAGVGQVLIGSLQLSGRSPTVAGNGTLMLKIPGMDEVTGRVRVNNSKVSGRLELGVREFPDGLPLRNGRLVVTLAEDGNLGFSGQVGVSLGPAGEGQLQASYEQGRLAMGATLQLTVPGMQPVNVTVNYADGALSGSVEAPIDPELIPGLSGTVHVEYAQDLWSGTTTLAYSADDGKLSGTITVTVTQTEQGTLELGGSGQVTAQLMPNLAGTLTATILPEGGVDVSGTIEVTEPVQLFDEKRTEKELFSHSQNIPLWAMLVAVIRIRAGVRAGIGPGVFRNITVTGSYTLGADQADPTFSVTGELFIPAFVEGYVAFGAGLGLDVVLGSLTGGIEAMGTAGLYGAISVIPELAYQDGQWSIAGVATLAAGARLKLSLNAWAEIEALWVTVWDNTWELASVTMPIGPDLALQARMNYVFGRPEPPELEFSSSDIDSESLIQSAMPEDGPPPSGAREALENKAEWQGALREQRAASVPPELAAQAQQGQAAPAAPPRPPERTGPPAGTQAGQAPAPSTEPATADRSAHEQAAVATAAATDDTLPAAVPAGQLPATDTPRFAGPITLATLDEPPVPLPRTKEQEHQDLQAAKTAVELASAQATSSDTLDDYFPRIKQRFRLSSLAYEGDFGTGFKVVGAINPHFVAQLSGEPLQGRGVMAADDEHQSEVKFFSSRLEGTEVGIEMQARPLGPDHLLGSEPHGQDMLMTRLGREYIRGHLLNEHLGGPGEPRNLFPITRSANAMHSSRIEETIKKWVNADRYWVQYDVKITGEDQIQTDDQGRDYINSSIHAEAWVLDTNLRPFKSVSTEISSTYGLSSSATNAAENTAAVEEVAQTHVARAEDQQIEVLASADGRTAFPNSIRDALTQKLAGSTWAAILDKLQGYKGFGESARVVLKTAYDRAVTSPDGLVQLDSAAEKARLTWIVNRWAELVQLL